MHATVRSTLHRPIPHAISHSRRLGGGQLSQAASELVCGRMMRKQSICVAVAFVVLVALLAAWQREKKFSRSPGTLVSRSPGSLVHFGSYCNLSCPFEWSKYSCVLQGQHDKAAQAREHVHRALDGLGDLRLPAGRRVVFVGDSQLRQVFIAIACALEASGSVAEKRMDWASTTAWPCHGYPACRSFDIHSGFAVASLFTHDGSEIHFIPLAGTSLPWPSPHTREQPGLLERWLEDGPRLKPGMTAMTTQYGERLDRGHARDFLVLGVGIHFPANAKEMIRTVRRLAEVQLGRAAVLYVPVVTSHFNTLDGLQGNGVAAQTCVASIRSNVRSEVELGLLAGVPAVQVLAWGDSSLGLLHVGFGDCVHWCMPGPADVMGARVVRAVAASAS